MKRISSVFFIIVLLGSCKKSGHEQLQKIKSIENLDSKNIELKKISSNIFLGQPSKIFEQNNILYITDLYEGKAVTAYNIETDSLIGRFFNIGQGPNEISWPIQLDISLQRISVFERQTGRYREYSLDDILLGNQYSQQKELFFEGADQFIKTNFGFVCTGPFEPGLVNLHDENGVLIKNINPFQERLNNTFNNVEERFFVGQGMMSYNRNNNSFLYAAYFTGDIFTYENSDSLLNKSKQIRIGKEIVKDNLRFQEIHKRHIYKVLDIGSSDNYHYVLYANNMETGNTKSNYLLKINPDGWINTCYVLDRYIDKFHIASDDRYIWGIFLNNAGNYEVHKAQLPND